LCSTRITGFFRSFPDRAPTEVMTTIGSPVRARVVARVPPEASNSATWSRTHFWVLGSYSPEMPCLHQHHEGSPDFHPAALLRSALAHEAEVNVADCPDAPNERVDAERARVDLEGWGVLLLAVRNLDDQGRRPAYQAS
jgi:hypothetical protein